jgi:hypothetical protein
MSAPGSPPPNGARDRNGGGALGQVLGAILNVSDWKRATLLIVLAGAGLVGLIVYQARDRLIATATTFFETAPRPTLSIAVAQRIADELREWPDVTIATVWAIDVERNLRFLIAFAGDAERTAVVTAHPNLLDRLRRGYPLLRYQGGANAPFIHLLNGEMWCGAPHPTLEEAPFYDDAHLVFFCLQGVPPEPGVLNGMLVVGYQTPRSSGQVEQLKPLLWDAADRLTERGRAPRKEPP